MLAGRDTIGLLPTGGGKSVTFQVPAMLLPGITVVVTPLISLMKDQVDNLNAVGIRAVYLHSGLTLRETNLALDRCRLRKARLLYISPEKLQSPSLPTSYASSTSASLWSTRLTASLNGAMTSARHTSASPHCADVPQGAGSRPDSLGHA